MADINAQYQQAKDAGYSDAEIAQHLGGDKYKEAVKAGYSDTEIIKHLVGSQPAPKAADPKFYELEKQPGLPDSVGGLVKQMGKTFVNEAGSMTGSAYSGAAKVASELASQAGNDVAKGLINNGKGIARTAGFVTSAALDPQSYVMGGMVKGQEAIKKGLAQSLQKPAVADMIENLKNQSAPLKAEIETQTKTIMEKVKGIFKEHGDALNAEKAKIGLPTSNAEREASIVKNGNPHNLGTDNLNSEFRNIIEPTKKAEELVKNVNKFKQMAATMDDEGMKAKLASVLQDNINSVVDWNKSGTTTEGVLKSQYNDLKQMALPASLKTAKAGMAEAFKLVDELNGKLDTPGAAEQYLRTIVTGKSAINKDKLSAIRHLEEMTGTKLFDKIEHAVTVEKSAEAAIKKMEKFKAPEAKAVAEKGISAQDLLSFKFTGWHSLVQHIVEASSKLKGPAKTAAKRVPVAGASKGLNIMGQDASNRNQLDAVMQRLKDAN